MKWKYNLKKIKMDGYHGLVCTEIPCGCNFSNFQQCKEYDDGQNDHDCVPAYMTVCR